MSISRAAKTIDELMAKRVAGVAAFRATVTDVDGSLVQIQRLGEDAAGTEEYATVSRFQLHEDDVVLCIPLGGRPVIIDVIRYAATIPYPLADCGPLFYASGTTTSPAGSPDASTTSTGTYATAFSDTWLLPAGTWSVTGVGGCGFKHSASADVDFYVEVNGAGALTRTPSLSSTVYTWWEDHANATGIVSDGVTPITVKLLYRSHSAGTTTPQAPQIALAAWRTA